MKKVEPAAPHAVLLVLDATVGQNALSQATEFTRIAGVTGLVMTKLDGTARGGILVALAAKHKLPVHFIGVGEGVEDLSPFWPRILPGRWRVWNSDGIAAWRWSLAPESLNRSADHADLAAAGDRRYHHRNDGKPIEPIGKIHRVAGTDNDEGAEQDEEPAEVDHQLLEKG